MIEKIFIPSKKRFNNSKLLDYFDNNKSKINLIIEPSEYEDYYSKYKFFNYIILPENNRGITYVRNYIKEYTEKNNIEFYWQLDDDITGFYKRNGTKLIKETENVLTMATEQFIKNGISLGALEYRQFAWSASKEIIINSFCDSCVYVNNKDTYGFRYNPYLEGKEDRDFAMQIIKSGLKTARTTLYAFSSPPNGSNSGGLKEIFYDLNKEEICSERMVEVWGDNICKRITKPDGRKDVKIIWSNINNNQFLLF